MVNIRGSERYYVDTLGCEESTEHRAYLISDEGTHVIVPLMALVAASPVVRSAAKGHCPCQEVSISVPGFSQETLELLAMFLSGKEVAITNVAVTHFRVLCCAFGIDCGVFSTSVIPDKDPLDTNDDVFLPEPMDDYSLQDMIKEEDSSDTNEGWFGVDVEEPSSASGDLYVLNATSNNYKCSDQETTEMNTDEYGTAETQDENHAKEATSGILPEKFKSLVKYEKVLLLFQNWRSTKQITGAVDEDTLLAYFTEKAKIYKPSTLWAQYSMLKATLQMRENIYIGQFSKLSRFLKQQSVGYVASTTKVLERDDINKFLLTAPDHTYLCMKVALIIGVAGACRRYELSGLKIDDVADKDSVLVITITDKATHKQRIVTIMNEKDNPVDLLALYRKYLALRPPAVLHRRLFLFYNRGKCSSQPVGINMFSKIPQKIAEFLGLENPELYTGHCFRRSSDSLPGNTGRAHRWKN